MGTVTLESSQWSNLIRSHSEQRTKIRKLESELNEQSKTIKKYEDGSEKARMEGRIRTLEGKLEKAQVRLAEKDGVISKSRNEIALLRSERDSLRKQIGDLEHSARCLQSTVAALEKKRQELEERLGAKSKEAATLGETVGILNAEILKLKKEVERLYSLTIRDSSNSGFTTSQTMPDKDAKRNPGKPNTQVPNSRQDRERAAEESGVPKASVGAGKGHERHILDGSGIKPDEVVTVIHEAPEECPKCGKTLGGEADEVVKSVFEVEVRVVEYRHVFKQRKCSCCGKKRHEPIPANLKEAYQYGAKTDALILSCRNSGNIPVNRTAKFIEGLSAGRIQVSEGYICKTQQIMARQLEVFRDSAKAFTIRLAILHWDDTVIWVDGKRQCMRFYGNGRICIYTAHAQKNKEGLDEDGILLLLTEFTTVVHDHVTVNYNADYIFTNLECNVHLCRDLQKLYDVSGNSWALELKRLINQTLDSRKTRIAEGKSDFTDEEKGAFYDRYSKLKEEGRRQAELDKDHYYYGDENALLNRLDKYGENYFGWIEDFELPADNNLAERSIRFVKSFLHAAGQFKNTANADCYALISTYMKTCLANGLNAVDALIRAAEGKPYTFEEVMAFGNARYGELKTLPEELLKTSVRFNPVLEDTDSKAV